MAQDHSVFSNIQDNRIVKQAVVIAYRLENKTK